MPLVQNTLLQTGKYRIVRFISAGGFGCTYEGEHIMLHKRIAIKEFFVKDFCNRDEKTSHVTVGTQSKVALVEKLRQKFIDEAVALSQLSHPNIISVSDVFMENGTAYYVMDYIDGRSLHEIVKERGALPEQEATAYIMEIADALKYVHSLNRLHLDIKPGNIMIDKNGKAILIDFGASKQYDEVDGENTSTLLGKTPGYAPIEQMGNRVQTFSAATDIYALGATFFKLLTGITPPDATEIFNEGITDVPSTISVLAKKAIIHSMELRIKDRPQNIDEFLKIFTPNDKTGTAFNNSESKSDEETIIDTYNESLDVNIHGNYTPNQEVNVVSTPKRKGTLTIQYDGYWIIRDCTIHIYESNQHIADGSFKKPWTQIIYLSDSFVALKFSVQRITMDCKFKVDPTKNYVCELTYDRIWVKLHVTVNDSQNNIIFRN